MLSSIPGTCLTRAETRGRFFFTFTARLQSAARIIERMKSNFDFKAYADRREGGGKETFSEMCRNNEIS